MLFEPACTLGNLFAQIFYQKLGRRHDGTIQSRDSEYDLRSNSVWCRERYCSHRQSSAKMQQEQLSSEAERTFQENGLEKKQRRKNEDKKKKSMPATTVWFCITSPVYIHAISVDHSSFISVNGVVLRWPSFEPLQVSYYFQ